MTEETFSSRHGFRETAEIEVTVRHDAPYELRGVIVDIANECGIQPKPLRSLVCRVLRRRPDDNNWSDYPNVDGEVRRLLDECEWYKVYDVIEAMRQHIANHGYNIDKFDAETNAYFAENGIGWQLSDGRLEVRAPEALQEALETAKETLQATGLRTAQQELHEALKDLSRRPNPDVSGAIQHSMAALECVAREITGNPKSTLGEIMKYHPELAPKPLDDVIKRCWGYASEHARHVREGRVAGYEEAELVVGVCATVSTYLTRKHGSR